MCQGSGWARCVKTGAGSEFLWTVGKSGDVLLPHTGSVGDHCCVHSPLHPRRGRPCPLLKHLLRFWSLLNFLRLPFTLKHEAMNM